ncbi:hypothetical protein CR513_40420, partial [Mucuna pruriens]
MNYSCKGGYLGVHTNSTIGFNTFVGLDADVMNALSSMFPSVYAIGPFPLLLNQSPRNHLPYLASNLLEGRYRVS